MTRSQILADRPSADALRTRAVVLSMCLGLAASAFPSAVFAQPAPAAPAPPEDPKLGAAKELFRQGVVLFNAGDLERALDLFLRSRALVPAGKNTTNAAICLERLGRLDEAIELYEEVLVRFAAEVDDADRRAVAGTLSQLRQKVGSVDVSSNVDGAVVIDGRARARLPLATPIRVLPGSHVVRVLKDGYATEEARVDVKVAVTARVDILLKPLAAAGQLRVDDPSSPGASVFVDDVEVGQAPWQGTLGPGPHVVAIQHGDYGSGPKSAVVIQGQSTALVLHATLLGATVRLLTDPSSAALSIDGVPVGHGTWEGRLPVGSHLATVREAGYYDSSLTFTSALEGAPARARIALRIDPRHPRWPRPIAGHFSFTLWGGAGFGTSPGGDAEKQCPASCKSTGHLAGGGGGGRFIYRFPSGFGLELGGGYLALGAHTQRSVVDHTKAGERVVYALDDDVVIRGPFGEAGASYPLVLGRSFSLVGAANLGLMGASSRDAVTGTLTAKGETVPATVEGQNVPVLAMTLFAQPEIRAAFSSGAWSFGVSASALVFLLQGPKLPLGLLGPVPGECTKQKPAACTPYSRAVAGERAFENPVVFLPSAFVGLTF